MNKATLSKYWQSPESIDKSDIAELKSLSEEYPFAVGLKQLYCKALLLHQDFNFEKALKLTAIQTADRSEFRKFLLGTESEKKQYTIDEGEKQKTKGKVISLDPIPSDLEQPEKRKEKDVEGEKIESTQDSFKAKKEEKDPLNDLIMAQAVSASISQEVEPKPEDFKASKKITLEENSKHSMTGWLDALEGKKPEEKDDFQVRAEAIIDQFLATKPRITPKKEFYSADNKAKKSAEYSDDIISETLVKIFINQGHYDRALAGCDQLILRFPEKKSYFAGLIQQIKDLQKQK